MKNNGDQTRPLPLVVWAPYHPFRLHVNDIVRVEGKLGRVIRITECAAVVLVNQPKSEFTTRFDKHVRFQPSPKIVRIAANAEMEVLNRHPRSKRKRQRR